jgi:hypothetical protein
VKNIRNNDQMNRSDGLYHTVQDKDTVQEWHNSLRHLDVSIIKRLAEAGQLYITDKDTSTFRMEECEVCAVAKTTRLTFDNTPVQPRQPMKIVHSVIAGPLKPDVNGRIYYVTFIDDLTGLVCIGGLKCCEVTTRSTKVGYLMYLGNSNGLLLMLILPCALL